MNDKRFIWKALLSIGLIPFIMVIVCGIYYAINGFSALCMFNCTKEFGIIAFRDSIILYSYVFWPIYIIGLMLIILAIFKLRKNVNN